MTFTQMLASYYARFQGPSWKRRRLGSPLPAMPQGPLPKYAARINRGRWIVDCPICNSALDVTPADVMAICLDCGTEWFEVVFPTPAMKQEIERLILKRPGDSIQGMINSNWSPGESLDVVRAENAQHGVGV